MANEVTLYKCCAFCRGGPTSRNGVFSATNMPMLYFINDLCTEACKCNVSPTWHLSVMWYWQCLLWHRGRRQLSNNDARRGVLIHNNVCILLIHSMAKWWFSPKLKYMAITMPDHITFLFLNFPLWAFFIFFSNECMYVQIYLCERALLEASVQTYR